MLVNMWTSTPRPGLTTRLRLARCRVARRLAERMVLPNPFDIDVFVGMIAELRGRPIVLRPGVGLVDPEAACGLWMPRDDHDLTFVGLWIPRDDHDLILVHPQASSRHLEHIVFHEVGHMMCQHITEEVSLSDSPLFQGFLTQSGAVAKMLARTSYDTVAEREAEIFATVLGSRITASRPAFLDEPVHSEINDDSLTRLIAALSTTRPGHHH